jgi:hypothetical protein
LFLAASNLWHAKLVSELADLLVIGPKSKSNRTKGEDTGLSGGRSTLAGRRNIILPIAMYIVVVIVVIVVVVFISPLVLALLRCLAELYSKTSSTTAVLRSNLLACDRASTCRAYLLPFQPALEAAKM